MLEILCVLFWTSTVKKYLNKTDCSIFAGGGAGGGGRGGDLPSICKK